MGEVKEDGNWNKKSFLQEEAVSEVGAWEITNLVLAVANRNTSICSLKEDDIKKRAYSITRVVIKKIISNWETYGIKNTAQIEYVTEIVFSLSYLALTQPKDGGIKNLIKGITSEVHSVTEVNTPQKKGMLNKIFGNR